MTITKRILSLAAFVAALILNPQISSAETGAEALARKKAEDKAGPKPLPVEVKGTVTTTPAPGAPAPSTKGSPGGDKGPKVDSKVKIGPANRGARKSGMLAIHPVVFDWTLPCVQEYVAKMKALKMSPVPDIYGAKLPTKADQYIAYTSSDRTLSGTSQSQCRKGTEPVQHSPGIDAVKGAEKNPVCAVVRQWWLYAERSASRLAIDAPTVEIEEEDGTTGTYIRWGVVDGDVTQPTFGYSYCGTPLKSAATKEDLKAALEKAIREFWNAISAIWAKMGQVDEKNTEQDRRLDRIEARLNTRNVWGSIGATGLLAVRRPTTGGGGLDLGLILRQGDSQNWFWWINITLAVGHEHVFKTSLGACLDVSVNRYFGSAFFAGLVGKGCIAQSSDFASTAFASVGAGPQLGVRYNHFYLKAGVPIGGEFNTEVTPLPGGRQWVNVKPDVGATPYVSIGGWF